MTDSIPAPGQAFDSLNWLNSFLGRKKSLSYDELQPVFAFCLLWSFFESEACQAEASVSTIRQSVEASHKEGKLTMRKYEEYLKFFKTKYFPGNEPSDDQLNIFCRGNKNGNNTEKDIIRAAFNTSPDEKQVVSALLFLTYRVRNNLFHGEKALESLSSQMKLFHCVNGLLATYICDLRN